MAAMTRTIKFEVGFRAVFGVWFAAPSSNAEANAFAHANDLTKACVLEPLGLITHVSSCAMQMDRALVCMS